MLTGARTPDAMPNPRLAIGVFFILLICGDLAFIALHVVHAATPWLHGAHYSLETDGGIAEFYQYTKQLWVALCMGFAFLQSRSNAYVSWAALFGFLMVDDAVQLHEGAGRWLGRHLSLPSVLGLRPDDFGELLVAGAVGGALIVALCFSLWRERGHAWRVSKDLLVLTAALALCGVVVDMLHVIAHFRVPSAAAFLAVVEDGGEMLVVSAITAYAFNVVLYGGASGLDLVGTLQGWRSGSGPGASRGGAHERPAEAAGDDRARDVTAA